MRRPDCAGETVVRRDCKALCRSLRQHGIGGNHRDRGVALADRFLDELEADVRHVGRQRGGQAKATEFVTNFEGRCPEMTGTPNRYGPKRIGHGERADGDTTWQGRRCRAESTLQACGERACARADGADREVMRGAACRLVAKITVWRIAPPVLVAAIGEVEDDRRRDDRDARLAHLHASADLPKIGLHTGRRIEPERRSARKSDPVDFLKCIVRLECIRLAGAGRAAQHLYASHRGALCQHDADTALETLVLSVADANAFNVGDEVPGAGTKRHEATRQAGNGCRYIAAGGRDFQQGRLWHQTRLSRSTSRIFHLKGWMGAAWRSPPPG